MRQHVAYTLPAATLLIALGFLSAHAEDAATSPPAEETVAKAPAAPTPATEPTAPPAAAATAEITKPPGGWRAVKQGDEIYWCTNGAITGSRVRTERQCMTPAQYKEMVINTRKEAEDMTRRVLPPKGN